MLYVAGWAAMCWSLSVSVWLTLLLAVPTGLFVVRLFIFQHDCGHRSFFQSKKVNDFNGAILGVITFTPYHAWRREHASHHATSGDLDRLGEIRRDLDSDGRRVSASRLVAAAVLPRVPMGNQADALRTSREASLTSTELSGVVDLLLASSTQEQAAFVLSDPRQALRQSGEGYVHHWDPRLSTAGNRLAKRLALLLDGLAKMQSWLRYQGRGELQACDREHLESGFER